MSTRRYDSRRQALNAGESQLGSGSYSYRYNDPLTNKRCYLYAKSLPLLREKEQKLKRDIEDGIAVGSDAKNLTLNELIQRYLSLKKVRVTTSLVYIRNWKRYIKDTIGLLKVVQIKHSDVQEFYMQLDQRGLSHNTLMIVQGMLSPALEMAVDDDLIRKNPAKGAVGNFGKPLKKKIALTQLQQDLLLSYVKKSNVYNVYWPLLTVVFNSALRCGEVLGLSWDNVDMKKREITIDHQVRYDDIGNGREVFVAAPKSRAGVRTIPMTKAVYQAFCLQRKFNFLRGLNGDHPIGHFSHFIFLTKHNTPILPNALNQVLNEIVTGYNKAEKARASEEKREPCLMPHISAHILRHTCSTRMNELSVNGKVMQTILGHEKFETTMNIYTHVDEDLKKREMDKLNEAEKKVI